jgi:ADP-heptose:LPS heptosyltransferase
MNQSLVIALLRLGDLLQSFPAITDLGRRQMGRGIALLVQKDLLPVAELHPHVDRAIPFNGDELLGALFGDGHWSDQGLNYLDNLVSEIEFFDPDTVVNLTHTAFSANLCGTITDVEIRGRINSRSNGPGFHGDWSRYFFTLLSDRSCNPFNIVDIFREIADGHRGTLPELTVSPGESLLVNQQLDNAPKRPLVAVGVGANHPLRRWPVRNWIAALSLLKQQIDPTFVLLGGSNETGTASAIENTLGDRCINLCGKTELSELASFIDQCDLFIGHDTGPVHLAAMLGKPSVAIYLAMASAWETAPYQQGSVAIEPDVACHPCNEAGGCNDPICHNAISPDAVAEAVLQILGDGGLQKHSGCLLRIPEFSSDGRLTLCGDRKAGDEKRLLWLHLMDQILDMDSVIPFMPSMDIDISILERLSVEVQQLKADALRLAQKSLDELRGGAALKWCSYGDALSQEIPRLTARYPYFRPLFELYRLDCQMGNGDQALSTVERVITAQENLLKRIGIIQGIISSADRKDLHKHPASDYSAEIFYDAVTA